MKIMATVEQLLNEARALPVSERRKLRDALARDLQSKPAYNTRERERTWIKAHCDEYLNQWVVVEGETLVAHGTDAREVYLAARAAGIKVPFLEQVTLNTEPYMGSWV